MAKQLMFDEDARRKVLSGIRKLSGVVKITLGPTGRNVLLDKKFGSPQATKDGVTVAKEIELKDPFENVGAKLANSVSDKTNDAAGDGTTTAAVLVEAISSEGLKQVQAGCNPIALKRGIDKAVEAVVREIKTMSRPVSGRDDYKHVAAISAHGEASIGEQIADAMVKVGKEGVITVEEGKGRETEIEYVDGMQFDKGFVSPYFITHPSSLTVEYEDAYLLLTDKKLSNPEELIPILEQTAQVGRPLVIVCEELEGQALALLVINKLRGVLKCAAIKAPAFGDRRKAMLQDMAVLTGGKVVSDDLGIKIEKLKLEDLGRVKQIKVEKEKTTMIGGQGSRKDIDARITELRTSIKKTTSEYDREKFEERLAKLQGGVAIIRVGGTTEAEMKERKYRVEDAVHATRAAAQEGVIPGGGVAYLRAIPAVQALALDGDEKIGARVVAAALEAPLYTIAFNCGQDPLVVVEEVKSRSGDVGFDGATGEFGSLIAAGVLDPAKIARLALQHAASVASLIITSRAMVTEVKDTKQKVEGAIK